MRILRIIRDYLFYCGIKRDEYRKLKKDAYISNFEVWRVLHCLMTAVFAMLVVVSLTIKFVSPNMIFYMFGFAYSVIVSLMFLFVLRKDSLIAQLIIYLSISLLFLFACFITQNKPEVPATTFIVFLLIAPMFMIDKPYFMLIELGTASTIFLVWMRSVKPYNIWMMDAMNIIVFAIVGLFLHIIANSLRIKEFVLSRKLNIQKDIDELTGIKNKAALTREINKYLGDKTNEKGVLFMMDIDHFKMVNDTYGHDVGDSVISQLGSLLSTLFPNGEVVGRFGGDEFIVFIKNSNDKTLAEEAAKKIISSARENIQLPDIDKKVSISIGIAVYNGVENNYSELFKKADVALYRTKANRVVGFNFYEDAAPANE